MKDFMAKISDYLNERRSDPERRESQLAVVITGAVAVVIIVLLLLLLWGYTVRERRQKEEAAELETALEELEEDEQLVAETFEEDAEIYMAQNDGQEQLRQEYLESIEYLNEKVEELLSSMTQIEKNVSETIIQYQEGDQSILKQMETLHTEITSIVQNLKKTETKLYDLIDIVQVMDQTTIPVIQQQILEIRHDMGKAQTDISNLYTKIVALQQEDVKLWAGIEDVKKSLKNAVDKNMTEVNNQLDVLLNQLSSIENQLGAVENQLGTVENQLGTVENQLGTVENRLQGLSSKILKYRYDAESNTLYLEPYTE